MKKLTDRELDSLFKEAAEGYQPPFDAASWDAMAGKLAQPVKRFAWPRWLTFSLIGAFIFLTGMWVGVSMRNSNNSSERKEPIREAQLRDDSQIPGAVKSDDSIITEAERTATSVAQNNIEQKEFQKDISDKSVKEIFAKNDNEHESQVLIVKDETNEFVQTGVVLSDSARETRSQIEDKNVFSKSDSVEVVQELNVKQVPDSIASGMGMKENGDDKKNKSKGNPFFFRALVSPDFSSISFAPTQSVGTNYSLLFEYPLLKNLYVSSGAILSRKVYSSDDEIVYGKYRADGVDGACQILDIPVNFYYLFNSSKKLSVYTGIGVSSYLMLDEKYTFYVNTNSGTRAFDWSFKGENNEWFKMLNLSVGLQYHISDRIYLQAEPFVKAPLAGVGEWDIELSSWGVFLGVKYQLNK